MSLPLGAHLHYRCSFDLVPAPSENPVWGDIVKQIRSWIRQRAGPDEALGRRWFFTGGEWKGPNRQQVRTASVIGTGTDSAPQHWALQYEHPCAEIRQRRWRTDIGITALEPTRLRFTLSTMHWLLPGFIGEEPTPPVRNAPAIVGQLLQSKNWSAFAGSERLTAHPVALKEGQGGGFKQRLESGSRTCPFILVTLFSSTGASKVNPDRLAKCLAGNAVVFSAATPGVDKELEWLLPRNFRCWNGMVRVYQPDVRFDDERDGVRHRFFSAPDIDELTPTKVEDILIAGIVRRGWPVVSAAVASLEDVAAKQRDNRIAELRAASQHQGLQDRLKSLEEEIALYEEEHHELAEKVKMLDSDRERMQGETIALEDKVSRLTYEKQHFQQRSEQVEATICALQSRLQAVTRLTQLPETLPEVIECIEGLHAGKIVFTDRAKESAGKSSFDDADEAWECLWAMATHLHALHFDGSKWSGNIDDAFKARSGFDLALTEKRLTKADKKLMALRKDIWDGEEIDITPHVKAGREPHLLRVHYYACPKTKQIVVGHCGDHLDTSGTRKRK